MQKEIGITGQARAESRENNRLKVENQVFCSPDNRALSCEV